MFTCNAVDKQIRVYLYNGLQYSNEAKGAPVTQQKTNKSYED